MDPLRGAGPRVPTLVGRSSELDLLAQRLVSPGVLIAGDAGIGKTTLWHATVARERDRGRLVLTAAPAEAEQTYSYAVLADLLAPVVDETLCALPAPQRRALEQALVLEGSAEPIDPYLVAAAVRGGIDALGARHEVVVAVDDAQWADAASMAALAFALRRSSNAVMLLSARTGCDVPLRLQLERIELRGLSVGALHHLIVERLDKRLSRPALIRVHEMSGGNPFYALELARTYGTDRGLVLSEPLHLLVSNRVRALPRPTRRALATLALGGAPPSTEPLDPAVDADVLTPAGRFVHPLFAEAAVALLAPDEARALHGEIAATTSDPEQRVRHRALAAVGPDEEVAGSLAAAAEAAARRGALFAAAQLWQHAAEMTDPDERVTRAGRLVEAGINRVLAGDPDAGIEMLDVGLPLLPPGPLRHRGLIHQALRLGRADSRAVIPVLEQALAEADDARVRHESVALLASFLGVVGDSARATGLVRAHLRWAETTAPEVLAPALLLAAGHETLLDRPAWELLERARAAVADEPDAGRPAWSWSLRAPALMREDRWHEARAAVEAAGENRQTGTVYQEGSRLTCLAMIELAIGDPKAALALADEALCLGEQIDAPYLICSGHAAVAEAATIVGDVDTARRAVTTALARATGVHALLHVDGIRNVLGFLELSLGDASAAAAAYEAVTDDGYEHFGAVAGARPAVDAVEALCLAGLPDRSHRIAARLPADAREHDVARALLTAAGGDLESALELLTSVRPSAAPYRQARELLIQGRWLRQLRRRSAARAALTAAREQFDRIGAPLWVARADDEIGRLGGRRPSGSLLTESERRVADLVAGGLSNKEVAARLVVTVRTVEVHLSSIYAKLGVPSRTALAARWPVV